MCVIIVKPANKEISEEILRSGYRLNPHGWGIMALDEFNNVMMSKGVETDEEQKSDVGFQKFYQEYLKNYADKECAVHFRVRTAGKIDVDNAHPYYVAPNVYMMHNGGINIRQPDKDKSDSYHFAKLIAPLADQLHDPKIMQIIEHSVGNGNRLVFLDKDGFTCVNKHEGTEYAGCWFSNTYGWDYPYKFYGYWGADYEHDGGFSLKGKSSSSKEFLETGSSGETIRGIYLPDGTRIVLDEKRAKTPASSQEMDLEQAKKILDACKEMENQCSSEEELYDYMADNTDLINKAMEVLLEEEQRQEDTEKKEHTNLAVEEDDDVMFVPQDFTGWAALNRNQIRRINYEDPDSIADALFDLLQGSLVGA